MRRRSARPGCSWHACPVDPLTKSAFVQSEFRQALSAFGERPPGSIYLIPVRLDECDVPDLQIPDRGLSLKDIHWVDLWQEGGFEQLLADLEYALAVAGSPPQVVGEVPPTTLRSPEPVVPESKVTHDHGPVRTAPSETDGFSSEPPNEEHRVRPASARPTVPDQEVIDDLREEPIVEPPPKREGGFWSTSLRYPAIVAAIMAAIAIVAAALWLRTVDPTPGSSGAIDPEPQEPTLPSVAESTPQEPAVADEPDPGAIEAALNLRQEDRQMVQEALTVLDFDAHGTDGVFGANTRRAIIGWQRSRGDEPTGYLSATQYGQLLAEAERQMPERPPPVQPAVGINDQDPPYEPGDEFRDCENCPLMVVVPGGSFMMGSTEAERKWAVEQGAKQEWVDWEKPQHSVRVEQPFAVGKYEVTRDQFAAFVQATGHDMSGGCWEYAAGEWKENASLSWRSPGFEQTDRDPAVCVSWDDAKAYAAWLSDTTTGRRYRLPSEAEWEYAARATTTTMRPWGDDRDNKAGCAYANGADLIAKDKFNNWRTMDCRDGQVYTAPVGSYSANAFKLHDVIGNAWEWVEDCWNDSYEAPQRPDDGSVWKNGDCGRRVLRGGSWYINPEYLRSAFRDGFEPDGRFDFLGFRVARTLSRGESVIP